MAEKPSVLEIYWILMKPRVVFLLQATAINEAVNIRAMNR